MGSAWSVRQVVDRAVRLGVVDAAVPARQLDAGGLDGTLDYFGEPDHRALLRLLDELGIVYGIEHKTFRDAHEDGVALYEGELDRIARCGRGQFTLTDVELVDDGDDHLLRFRCNGERLRWPIMHSDDPEAEGFDASLTFSTYLGDIVPAGAGTARWCSVDSTDPDAGVRFVFADPEALGALGAPFGVEFSPIP
jgi:hypothetical protein